MRKILLTSAALLGLASLPALANDNVANITQTGMSLLATQSLTGTGNKADTTQLGYSNEAAIAVLNSNKSDVKQRQGTTNPYAAWNKASVTISNGGAPGALPNVGNAVTQDQNGYYGTVTTTIEGGRGNDIKQIQKSTSASSTATVETFYSNKAVVTQTQAGGERNEAYTYVSGNNDTIEQSQSGNYNKASVKSMGDGNVVTQTQTGDRNRATVYALGNHDHSITQTQHGNDNQAEADAFGNGGKITSDQYGNSNYVMQVDNGDRSTLYAYQSGSNNVASQYVSGGTGNSASISQIGLSNVATQTVH